MIGSTLVTQRFLVISFLLLLLTGCQFLPTSQEKPVLVTSQQLEASSQALQASFQKQLLASEERQLTNLEQQAAQVQQLKKLVKNFQQENLRLQQQHTFQIEQLGNLLEPGFAKSHLTEVVQEDGKMLLGEHEWIFLPEQKLVLPARIDSGANTSSLHAVNLQQFERDGKTWVRFETHYQPEEDQPAYKAEIEAPLVRKVKVTQASGSTVRPVVSLPIQLGALNQSVEFTLADRGSLTFPVLLGRRFFMDIAVIDVSKAYVQGKPKKPDETAKLPLNEQEKAL
ncbi:RimK/LysX family protein [Marinospirillum insulare]|uniref:ATP-dependent Zn protease n=1 Tax=Marinospirillum insulare TaxID=217169 RepID=A0ABQ5ZWF2_9GAMM|nr:RimK/LysX family protein [Marinospirillum insulare]GLR63791.1 ATP-dependent Zn protease [Marinospirillum insulare]